MGGTRASSGHAMTSSRPTRLSTPTTRQSGCAPCAPSALHSAARHTVSTWSQAAAGASPVASPASSGGWLSSLEGWLGHGAALAGTVLLGVALLGVGLFLAARGAGVKVPVGVKMA